MRGFTLIEVVISVSLVIILSLVGFSVFNNRRSGVYNLDSARQIVQNLRLAKEKNFSGIHDSSHGVYFIISPSGADSMVLYEGPSYDLRNSIYDREFIFSSVVSLSGSSFSFSGNNIDINFSGVESIPSNTGTIYISQADKDTAEVVLDESGLINW